LDVALGQASHDRFAACNLACGAQQLAIRTVHQRVATLQYAQRVECLKAKLCAFDA
jgi:hypothetical protein